MSASRRRGRTRDTFCFTAVSAAQRGRCPWRVGYARSQLCQEHTSLSFINTTAEPPSKAYCPHHPPSSWVRGRPQTKTQDASSGRDGRSQGRHETLPPASSTHGLVRRVTTEASSSFTIDSILSRADSVPGLCGPQGPSSE